MKPACLVLAASWLAWGGAHASPAPQRPEDLGASTIDVSDYPPEYQKTYRESLLRVYKNTPGGVARVINSPVIELDPRGEAALRREHPELFTEPGLAEVSADGWRREVATQKNRPPCCGACSIVSLQEARRLWKFLAYDSIRRKTGPKAAAWVACRRKLIAEFEAKRRQSWTETARSR